MDMKNKCGESEWEFENSDSDNEEIFRKQEVNSLVTTKQNWSADHNVLLEIHIAETSFWEVSAIGLLILSIILSLQ